MSFGKRTAPTKQHASPRTPQPQAPSNDQTGYHSRPAESLLSHVIFLAAIFLFIGSASFLVLYFLPKPLFLTSQGKVYYSYRAFSKMAIASMTPPRSLVHKQNENHPKIDLSRLILKNDLTDDDVMLAVSKQCLPAKVPTGTINPIRGHTHYDKITKYITCIMKTDIQRFCQGSERHRLVSQLRQYSIFRQSLLGIERISSQMMSATSSGRQAQFNMQISGSQMFPPIGDNIDDRVIDQLSKLISRGYFTKSDFSFMGLSLPKAYAPAFTSTPESQTPNCDHAA